MTIISKYLDKMIDQQILLNWLPLPTTQSTLSDVAQQIYLNDETFDREWNDLRFIPWRFFYLDYHHLKQNTVTFKYAGEIDKQLESEWSKVYDFYCLKKSEIERRMTSYYTQQQQVNNEDLKALMMDIHHLYHFAKLNFCGFTRLLMQYDRLLRLFGSSFAATKSGLLLNRVLINKPFWDHSIELYDMATRLNYLYVNYPVQQQKMHTFDSGDSLDITILAINPSPPQSYFNATRSLSKVVNGQDDINNNPTIFPLSTNSSTSPCSSASSSNTKALLSYQLPTKHSKTVKKYWVHPDNIVEVMLLLSSNKEMVLQNQDNNPSHTCTAVDELGYPQVDLPQSTHQHEKSHTKNDIFTKPSSSTKVTTIYMDSLDFNDYTEQVIGQQPIIYDRYASEKCVTTRVRHYTPCPSVIGGALSNKNNISKELDEDQQQRLYHSIEQKVYYKDQESDVSCNKTDGKKPQQKYCSSNSDNDDQRPGTISKRHDWIQQRIWLKSKHLQSWMNGRYSFSRLYSKATCQYRKESLPTFDQDERKTMEKASYEIEEEVHNKLKVPVLEVTQNRVVYLSSDSNVSISIATDIAIMRFKDDDDLDNSKEEKYPYYTMSPNDIVRFPYCVIQISQAEDTTAFNQELKSLLEKLDSSPLLKPVDDYSSFLHGVGRLFSNQVHMFPTWFSELDEEQQQQVDDLRHTQHRGSLLFTKTVAVSEEVGKAKNNISSATTIVTINNSSGSSINGMNSSYCNRTNNTIATIITCYDDEEEDYTQPKYLQHSPSSSCSSSSSLLSPNKQRIRRSFDSYCSFDHPTSSSSDPTNCKSCMERYFNEAYDDNMGSNTKRRDGSKDKECITFLSVMKDVLERLKRGVSVGSRLEKEPLLNGIKIRHLYSDDEELALQFTTSNNNKNNRFSRASIVTSSCIVLSFIVSYLMYSLCILNK